MPGSGVVSKSLPLHHVPHTPVKHVLPKIVLRQFVDDLRLRATADTEKEAAETAAAAITRLLDLLVAGQCSLSLSKCALLANTALTGRFVLQRLATIGWKLPLVSQCRDLVYVGVWC